VTDASVGDNDVKALICHCEVSAWVADSPTAQGVVHRDFSSQGQGQEPGLGSSWRAGSANYAAGVSWNMLSHTTMGSITSQTLGWPLAVVGDEAFLYKAVGDQLKTWSVCDYCGSTL
jgi:hypothetical protein